LSDRAFVSFPLALAVIGLGSLCPTLLHAQSEYPLAEVSFLSGCWAGGMGAIEVREQWTDDESGVMLGTTRYFRDGALVDFEFAMISLIDGEVTLWPYPGGERAPRGFALTRTGAEIVFENLEHDFPVRIVYAREGPDTLTPRIEGRDGETRGWRLHRVACPTGSG
jgi:hypothetical protein